MIKISSKKSLKRIKARTKVNGNVYVFDYITLRTSANKIVAGIIIKSLRKLLKNYRIKKGNKLNIEVEFLEVKIKKS